MSAALHTCTGNNRGLSPAQLADRCPACQALRSTPVEVTVHVFDEEPCPAHATEPGVCAAHGARVVEVWQ